MKEIGRKELTKYIFSFTLGDGWMTKRNKNANYGLHQLSIHKDYIEWQANILETLTSVNWRDIPAYINIQGAKAKASIRIETKTHPFYTTLYERIYTERKIKQISPHDLKLLDWETLAILYQDDGYIEVSPRITQENYVRIRIATDNFTYGDVVLLQRAIYEYTNIPFDIQRRKFKETYGYRLQARKDYAKRFIEGITPYVKPSYEYKLDIHTQTSKYFRMDTSTKVDGDMIYST